ncbi:MAG: fatty acid desaturase [Symplocastrum torsivum CPER-KK1]|jgi:fatty acid desaturase|uniref:Fatty acid desaturase n=1 Tax=Symplocastrum torsivum CPER-KK1 TaxID=450513 RepID=A0A951PJ23_9CYAN|nr:fatty acid desaturase [Symplocastrum torsivum CPER-KK1]
MNLSDKQPLIHQAQYAKMLRPLLPTEAFAPDPNKLIILFINLAILILGWAIAADLDRWQPSLLWLYLPLAIVMGNSVIVLLFSSHALMHGSVIKNSWLIQTIGLLGLTLWWMPPTLWKVIHNREHHTKTNSLADPDRNYLYEQPKTWGKWIQDLFVPSSEVNPLGLIVGMPTSWGVHGFRNLTSVLLFNRKSANYVPAAFTVSDKEYWAIAKEFLIILAIHLSIIAYLEFDLTKLLLSYFLPIGIGYAGGMFYIFTNHMLCQMTSTNDPLVNTISLRVPKLFDQLHLNFSYHTEHHIFPGMNSDYYPMVQELLKSQYPERLNLLDAGDVWRLLMQTPRHYQNDETFTDWSGEKAVPCPLSQEAKGLIKPNGIDCT